MFPLLALWLLFTASGRARARQAAELYRGEIVNPWTGQRVLPSQGGGLADPWADTSTSSSTSSSTSPTAPGYRWTTTDARTGETVPTNMLSAAPKLHWLFRAADRAAAQAAASVTLEKAIRALRATGPLNFSYTSITVQPSSAELGALKWYATVTVTDPAALGRLRAELGRTTGVQVLA